MVVEATEAGSVAERVWAAVPTRLRIVEKGECRLAREGNEVREGSGRVEAC